MPSRTDDAQTHRPPRDGSVVVLPKDRVPASAGVAWATLAFAILACVFAAIAMVRAGEARDAARDAGFRADTAVAEVDAGDAAG